MHKLVVAVYGHPSTAEAIRPLARSHEVIAVALDVGGALSLAALHDAALAAGAVRCHAFDVRDELVRDYLLPALRESSHADPQALWARCAAALASDTLRKIAAVEGARVVAPEPVAMAPRRRPVVAPARLEIAFEAGVPVAVNGVAMTLPELMESLETITGEPAPCVLARACQQSLTVGAA